MDFAQHYPAFATRSLTKRVKGSIRVLGSDDDEELAFIRKLLPEGSFRCTLAIPTLSQRKSWILLCTRATGASMAMRPECADIPPHAQGICR